MEANQEIDRIDLFSGVASLGMAERAVAEGHRSGALLVLEYFSRFYAARAGLEGKVAEVMATIRTGFPSFSLSLLHSRMDIQRLCREYQNTVLDQIVEKGARREW